MKAGVKHRPTLGYIRTQTIKVRFDQKHSLSTYLVLVYQTEGQQECFSYPQWVHCSLLSDDQHIPGTWDLFR